MTLLTSRGPYIWKYTTLTCYHLVLHCQIVGVYVLLLSAKFEMHSCTLCWFIWYLYLIAGFVKFARLCLKDTERHQLTEKKKRSILMTRDGILGLVVVWTNSICIKIGHEFDYLVVFCLSWLKNQSWDVLISPFHGVMGNGHKSIKAPRFFFIVVNRNG